MDFNERIRILRKEKKMTQQELADIVHLEQTTITKWETKGVIPREDILFSLVKIFDCSLDYLMGNSDFKKLPKKGVKIPVLGTIPAGIAIEAIEDILDYEEISEEMAATGDFFALKVKGDSMSPKIQNGDIVIIRKQEDCESGKICAVIVNGYDATLKEIKKDPQGIWVLPHNPGSDFKPTFYTNKEVNQLPVKIIGIAVEIRRAL